MYEKDETNWDLIIEPENSLLDLKLKKVWQYRDLLFLLVRRDFVAFYKQTILGPLWFLIQPLFTTATYVFIFGKLAGLSTDGVPPILFYLAGITTWTYFADCLTKTANVFKDNASIFGKVYFPRLIMPLSIVISNLIRLGVQILLLIGVMIYFSLTSGGFHISWYMLLFPFFILLMAAQGLGWGMMVSSLTTKYRDLALLVTFGIQILMYATPIVYPLSSLSGNLKLFVSLNPMTPIVEGMRKSFFGQGVFDIYTFIYASIISIIILFIVTIIYNKVEKNFIDTI